MVWRAQKGIARVVIATEVSGVSLLYGWFLLFLFLCLLLFLFVFVRRIYLSVSCGTCASYLHVLIQTAEVFVLQHGKYNEHSHQLKELLRCALVALDL